MSFQLQFGSLAKELQKAGIPQDAAVRLARILGNSAGPMRRGPEVTDTTRPAMSQVSAGNRKHWLTNTDFKEGDLDHRPQRNNLSENKSRPTQASALQSTPTPQATDKPFNVGAGTYTKTTAEGEGTSVGLNVKGTGTFLTQDGEANALNGVKIRAECDPGRNGLLQFWTEPRGEEFLLRIAFDEDKLQDLINAAVEFALRGVGQFGPSLQDAIISVALNGGCLEFKKIKGDTICIPVTQCSGDGPAPGPAPPTGPGNDGPVSPT